MSPGYSFVETVFAVGILTTVAGIGVPQMLAGLDDYRAEGAARYVAARLQRVRMEALTRSANVALQVSQSGSTFVYAVYADGNGDGVRSQDIRSAVDARLGTPEQLPDNFSGVDFGVLPGLPAVDSGSSPPGTDPIKLGSGNLLSFSPLGTSSSGSLYIRGRGTAQYVVRVMGATGRIHLLKFDTRASQWKPL